VRITIDLIERSVDIQWNYVPYGKHNLVLEDTDESSCSEFLLQTWVDKSEHSPRHFSDYRFFFFFFFRKVCYKENISIFSIGKTLKISIVIFFLMWLVRQEKCIFFQSALILRRPWQAMRVTYK